MHLRNDLMNRYSYNINKLLSLFLLSGIIFFNACRFNDSSKEFDTINKYIKPAFKKAVDLQLSNPDSSLLLCDYLIRLTNDNEQADSLRLEVLVLKTKIITNKGFDYKAIEMYKSYLPEYKEKQDNQALMLINSYIAEIHNKGGRYQEALKYVNEALAFSPNTADKYRGMVLNLKGLITTNLGQYKESQLALNEALSLYEKNNMRLECAHTLQNIGNLHFDLKDSFLARDYYLKSLSIHKEIGSKTDLASIYNNIGILYRHINPDSALYYYNQIPPQNGDSDILQNYVIGLFNKANIYRDKKEYQTARIIYQEVYTLCKENNILQGIPRVLFSFGDIEYETDNKAKGLAYVDEALHWCDSLGAISLKQDIMKSRIQMAKEMGNYKEAFLLQQQYNQIEDSIKNDETKATIKKIEKMNIEKIQILDKFEKEKQISQEKQNRNKQLVILLSVLMLSLSVLAGFRYIRKRASKAESSPQ